MVGNRDQFGDTFCVSALTRRKSTCCEQFIWIGWFGFQAFIQQTQHQTRVGFSKGVCQLIRQATAEKVRGAVRELLPGGGQSCQH